MRNILIISHQAKEISALFKAVGKKEFKKKGLSFGIDPAHPSKYDIALLDLDTEGCLWVEDVHLPGDTLRSWTVFDEEGVPLTRLSLPAENRVLDIGKDYVLTVFEDELGVESVQSYPLTRGG